MPKISVIIPAFNAEKYIRKAIDSVLDQKLIICEIIVVDDGSTDRTSEIVNNYLKIHGNKIRYYLQSNKGPSAARNHGIAKANGEFIYFLDSDDYLLDGCLKKSLSYLIKNTHDLVMSDNYVYYYSNKGRLLNKEYKHRAGYPDDRTKLFVSLFKRFQGGFDGEIRILIKKSLFNKIGLFDERLKILEDWDLWLRIASHNLAIGYLKEPLFVYRRHAESLCRNQRYKNLKLRNIYYAFKKNKKQAFKLNKDLRRNYGDTLWMVGTESLVSKKGFLFGLRCLLESQYYYLDVKKFTRIRGLLNILSNLF